MKCNYLSYLSNWFFIFNKINSDFVLAALYFFRSLDLYSKINNIWYLKYDYKTKPALGKIIIWWLINSKNIKRWFIFLNRFIALFIRTYFIRKN